MGDSGEFWRTIDTRHRLSFVVNKILPVTILVTCETIYIVNLTTAAPPNAMYQPLRFPGMCESGMTSPRDLVGHLFGTCNFSLDLCRLIKLLFPLCRSRIVMYGCLWEHCEQSLQVRCPCSPPLPFPLRSLRVLS